MKRILIIVMILIACDDKNKQSEFAKTGGIHASALIDENGTIINIGFYEELSPGVRLISISLNIKKSGIS